MQYTTILFDFDGTIADTSDGIFESILYALNHLHLPLLSKLQMRSFIGPPLQYSFQHVAGLDSMQAEKAVALYRENYEAGGQFRLRVYDGIPELLSVLRERGYKIGLASAKPDHFIQQILDHFGLCSCFDFAQGVSLEESYSDKSELIAHVLKKLRVSDLNTAWMIGDKKYDIEGAQKAGIHAAGVLYGFGSESELKTAGAELIFHTAEEIGHFFEK